MFFRVSPSVNLIINELKDEHNLWRLVGDKNIQGFGLGGLRLIWLGSSQSGLVISFYKASLLSL